MWARLHQALVESSTRPAWSTGRPRSRGRQPHPRSSRGPTPGRLPLTVAERGQSTICWSTRPVAVSLTGGNRNDVTQLLPVVDGVGPVRGKRGRPRLRADSLIVDRGYDHDKSRRELWARGVKPRILAARPVTAPALGGRAGSSNEPSPGCTSSAACACAGNAAPTSTRRFSPRLRRHLPALAQDLVKQVLSPSGRGTRSLAAWGPW